MQDIQILARMSRHFPDCQPQTNIGEKNQNKINNYIFIGKIVL
jgi:hypothetical protein